MANLTEGFSEPTNILVQSEEPEKDKEQRPAHPDEIPDEKRPPELSKDLTVNSKSNPKDKSNNF